MTTQFTISNARVSNARHPCTVLASLRNLCRFVRTNVSGQFSKELDSNQRKSLRRQPPDYCTITSRPWPWERTPYLFRSCCATCIPKSNTAIRPKYKIDIVQRCDGVTSKYRCSSSVRLRKSE